MHSNDAKLALAIHHLHNAIEVIARRTDVNVEKHLEACDVLTAEILARDGGLDVGEAAILGTLKYPG